MSNSLCQFLNDKLIPLQALYPFSVSWKINALYFFSSNNIDFAQKEPIKVKIFLRLSSAQVKICQIHYVSFETASQFLSKYLCPYSISWRITPLNFFSSNNILGSKGAHSNKIFWDFQVLQSKLVKFLMSTLKWQVNSSLSFGSFFIVMTDNSSVDFELILFQFWIKESHQNPNFESFKCSGENLPYSSYHFPNHK